MIPWIAAHPGGASIDELCQRFDIDRDKLLGDLAIASMVGLAPFTPDVLVEVIYDDEHVWVTLPQAFAKPLRLSPEQGLSLIVRTQGLLAVPGADRDGALARGLAKLAAALGVELDTTIGVSLGDTAAETLSVIREAIDTSRTIEFEYYTRSRDTHARRAVDPYKLGWARGAWYMDGHCHLAGSDRIFRVDRMSDPVLGDGHFEPPDNPETTAGFLPDGFRHSADLPTVELELSPSARWVVEQYRMDDICEGPDGSLKVRVPVGSPRWLERLVLRLGPEVRIVEAPEDLSQAVRSAKSRVVARYQSD